MKLVCGSLILIVFMAGIMSSKSLHFIFSVFFGTIVEFIGPQYSKNANNLSVVVF